ncbi:unnamed protein product, partial [Menidia menidia]
TCPPECEAGLDSQKRRLCRDFLFEEEKLFSLSDPQQEEKAVPPPVSEHSPDQELAAPGDQDEDGDVRMEILKIITAERERGGEGFTHGEEPVKRYGGFMRRAEGGGAPDHLLQVVLGRGLKKRYGGFMRRVGRPEWLVENSKSGGVMKRAWENGSGQQKRPAPVLWSLSPGPQTCSGPLESGLVQSDPTCPPECEAGLDSQKRRLCRDFLFEEEKLFSLSDPQQEEKAVPPPVSEHSPDQELAVNYDGFSKRYGGFMSRRAPPPRARGPGGPGRGRRRPHGNPEDHNGREGAGGGGVFPWGGASEEVWRIYAACGGGRGPGPPAPGGARPGPEEALRGLHEAGGQARVAGGEQQERGGDEEGLGERQRAAEEVRGLHGLGRPGPKAQRPKGPGPQTGSGPLESGSGSPDLLRSSGVWTCSVRPRPSVRGATGFVKCACASLIGSTCPE